MRSRHQAVRSPQQGWRWRSCLGHSCLGCLKRHELVSKNEVEETVLGVSRLTGIGEGRRSRETLVNRVHGLVNVDSRLNCTTEENAVVATAGTGSAVLDAKSVHHTATNARRESSKVVDVCLTAEIGI